VSFSLLLRIKVAIRSVSKCDRKGGSLSVDMDSTAKHFTRLVTFLVKRFVANKQIMLRVILQNNRSNGPSFHRSEQEAFRTSRPRMGLKGRQPAQGS